MIFAKLQIRRLVTHVSTHQLQGRNVSLLVAKIHVSIDAKNKMVEINVSAYKKSRSLTTAQISVQKNSKYGEPRPAENLTLEDVDLQELKDSYQQLKSYQIKNKRQKNFRLFTVNTATICITN